MSNFRFGNSPLFLKLLTLYRIPKDKVLKKDGVKPVFILATGRVGTKFFAELLNTDPNVTAYHEPKPSRILRLWTMAFFEREVNESQLKNVLVSKRERLFYKTKTPLYVESNPYMVGFLNVLREVFDEPTIIHVVRDPRDYIRSSVNHGNKRGLKKFFNRHLAYWQPDYKKILGSQQELDIGLKNATYWRIVNEFLHESSKGNPNYHLFKFENLFGKSDRDLKKLLKIIGIDESVLKRRPASKRVNRSRFDDFGKWQDWDKTYSREVENICEPYMSKFGYGKEKGWKEKISG